MRAFPFLLQVGASGLAAGAGYGLVAADPAVQRAYLGMPRERLGATPDGPQAVGPGS